jgi:hypothetical protein
MATSLLYLLIYSVFQDQQILAILDWVVGQPITALSEQRIGCTAQCPFCGCVCSGGVACQNEASQSQKHRAEIHMPQVFHFTKLQHIYRDKQTLSRLINKFTVFILSFETKEL